MIRAVLLVLVLGTLGCARPHSIEEPSPSDSVARVWKKASNSYPYKEQWNLVCPATGRLDGAQIVVTTQDSWKLFSQGGDYGEYESKEEAIRAAETLVKERVTVKQIQACAVPR